jgi:hypothetical protein
MTHRNPLEYVPTPGPLPGVQWEPSNGTCGHTFIAEWCGQCARDLEVNGTCQRGGRDAVDGDWCPILGASFMGAAVEWREMPDGEVKCTAFVPLGAAIPTPKCSHTPDMFDVEAETPEAPE